MVTISNADKALKTFYLGVLADQLNVGVNPLFAKIAQTSSDVWGKEVKKLAPYGINGGVGSGEENDNLPQSGGNNYAQFTLTLKNLFGKIELSDKAIRASQNSAGAFVNLLNAEMEGLLKASKFNFGRMLYGDGTGLIATTVAATTANKNQITVDSIKGIIEGMTIDMYSAQGAKDTVFSGARVTSIDRANKVVTLSATASTQYGAGYKIYVQGSRNNEITGLEAIFGDSEYIYGLKRSDYSFLKPYTKTVNSAVSISAIQDAIDVVEETSGGAIDFIVTSYKMRKQYVDALCKTAPTSTISPLTAATRHFPIRAFRLLRTDLSRTTTCTFSTARTSNSISFATGVGSKAKAARCSTKLQAKRAIAQRSSNTPTFFASVRWDRQNSPSTALPHRATTSRCPSIRTAAARWQVKSCSRADAQ